MVSKLARRHKGSVFESGSGHVKQSSMLREMTYETLFSKCCNFIRNMSVSDVGRTYCGAG